MALLLKSSLLLLVGLATAFPPSADHKKVVITKDFFPTRYMKYESHHDIVHILVPLNSFNFDNNDPSSSVSEILDLKITLFFVEADVDENKKRIYKGLYVLKDNKANKILENGQYAAASSDDSREVYFGAQDGLYKYKEETNEAVKYGPISDSIIGMAVTNESDIIYILTEDHELYKVTDNGNTKTKVEEVVNAQQIVLDFLNNLYFYAEDKQPYVFNGEGVKKIEGLPVNPTDVNLIKPPFILEDVVPFIVDNTAYILYANGTSKPSGLEFKPNAKPTAYAMEGTVIEYFAINKKIYEYNLVAMALDKRTSDEFKDLLEGNVSEVQVLTRKAKKKNKKD